MRARALSAVFGSQCAIGSGDERSQLPPRRPELPTPAPGLSKVDGGVREQWTTRRAEPKVTHGGPLSPLPTPVRRLK